MVPGPRRQLATPRRAQLAARCLRAERDLERAVQPCRQIGPPDRAAGAPTRAKPTRGRIARSRTAPRAALSSTAAACPEPCRSSNQPGSPSGPCALNRNTRSRTVCNPTPPVSAASRRVPPAQITANARSLRTSAASPLRRAKARKSDAEKSCRSPTAEAIANLPRFATVNHRKWPGGIPSLSQAQ